MIIYGNKFVIFLRHITTILNNTKRMKYESYENGLVKL